MPGDGEATDFGLLHIHRREEPLDSLVGGTPLRLADGLDAAHLAVLGADPALADIDPAGLLYVDLETTGLGLGAGSLPVVVGLGAITAGAWRLEQLFLRQPGEERPILQHLLARCRAASAWVSYNGKSFDLPFIRARLAMHRLPPLPERPHFDLLHAARRLFPGQRGALRLVDLERAVLGLARHGDIPGAAVPALYARYLREASPAAAAALAPVFAHNGDDIRGLAALAGVMVQRLAPPAAVALGTAEAVAAARLHLRAGDLAAALACLADDLPVGCAPVAAAAAWQLRGALARRAGNHAATVAHLERALAAAAAAGHSTGPTPRWRAQLHLQCAILLEHRLGAPGQALAHAQRTIDAEGLAASAHRQARIEARLAGRRWQRALAGR